MNLEKIEAGLRVPNYRKLCELLGEDPEAGNSKKAQLRKWERYFAYRREKNAYIITEIYAVPKPAEDGRMKYAQHLTPVLMHHLAQCGQEEHAFEWWFTALGMVEATLFDEEKQADVRSRMDLTPFQLQKLVYTVDTFCKRTLLTTLETMKKAQIADYEVKEYLVTSATRKLASVEEQKQFHECKAAIMAEMGVSNMFTVLINPGRKVRFYEMLNALCKERYGWDRAYTLLEIKPQNWEEIRKYENADVKPMMEALNGSIKAAVAAQLRAECESADRRMQEEWENDSVSSSFKLNRMLAETLIFILQDEL